jgi:hypothetical protein
MQKNDILIPGLTLRHLLPWALLLAMFLACQQVTVAADTVWQIGKFDHSSAEFKQETTGQPSSGSTLSQASVLYIIGKSSPKTDWPAYQPGSANTKAGHHPHPYSIRFNLPNAPKGRYFLKVGFVSVGRNDLPTLQLEINGQMGWVYHHAQWHDVPGDKYYADETSVEIPTPALKQGANTLILTAIDEPGSGEEAESKGLAYDAIEMDHDAGQAFDPSNVNVHIEPTIFYQYKDDHLVELVDIYVHSNSAVADGHFELKVGNQDVSASLTSNRNFGEERLQFALPEFAAGTSGEALVTRGENTQRIPVTLSPAKKWKLLIVSHEHIDVGYTDYQPKVAEIQSRVLDEAMEMIRQHPDYRYSVDGYWVIQEFLAGRNAEDRAKLLQMVREHKILVPADYANLLTEFPAVETLIRSLYPSHQFDRENGANFNYASITDVPSQSWSYSSVLASAGLKYFTSGSNQERGPILMLGDLGPRSPYYWEGPDGGKVLMWYANGYGHVGGIFGMPPGITTGRAALPGYLQMYASPEYKASTVMLYGAQWENSDLFPQQATLAEDWNKAYAYPQLAYSDFGSAIQEIANQLGDSIPVIKGDGGPYWEDGIYSDTQNAILARNIEQRAPSAEKLSTLSSLLHPNVQIERSAINQLWQNMLLFDEHTWGAWQSDSSPESEETVRQQAVKDAFATQAEQDMHYIMERGMAAISDYINDPKGTLVVFNTLNWQRNGLVEADLLKGSELIDLVSGNPVPYQVVSNLPNFPSDPSQPPFQRVRFVTQDVPPLGYKCYSIRTEGAKPVPAPAAAKPGTILENNFYRVTFDVQSGAVKSIFDKELKKELVDSGSPYRFDEYLYVSGGEQPPHNRLLFAGAKLPAPEIAIHRATAGHLVSIERTPFGTIAHLESSNTNTPKVQTDVILFDSQKKIEIINHVQKKAVYAKEAVYFAFPFAGDNPQVRYDLQNGVVDPTHDLLPGADREWFSLQHWTSVQSGGVTAAIVPEDAELFTLGDIVRGKWSTELDQHRGTIFSYVMNNYWWTNYVARQGGDFTFRYVVTSGKNLQPGELSRLGWEEMTPLEANEIIANDKETSPPRPLDKAQGSFLQVDQSNVVLVNWKAAEDGHGTILRFLEVAGTANQAEVQIPILQVQAAWMCNAVEENQQPLETTGHGVAFAVKPFQIVTVRVEGTPTVY